MITNTKLQRKRRTRAKVVRTDRPRLSVFRSNKDIYAQIIDDKKNTTLVSFSSKLLEAKEKKEKDNKEVAFMVGEKIASLAKKKKIKKVVFDRSGYKYHGRVQKLADGARKGGLQF